MIADFKYVLKWRCLVYFLIFIVIGIFIPIFIIFFVQSIIFSNKLDDIKGNNKNSTSEIVNNINKNGVSSLYELLVKYNYPCFKK